MSNMLAWYRDSGAWIRGEREEVPLRADQVRVRVQHVCLSPADLKQSERPPGGALVGEVFECGEAATAFASARVLVAPVQACGECDTCRRGFASVCPSRMVLGKDIDGGCATHIVADARWLTRLDHGLEEISGPEAALIAGPCLLAYGLFCRAGVGAGDTVIVLGRGPTAAILARLAQNRGSKVVSAHGDGAAIQLNKGVESLGSSSNSGPRRIFICDGGDENMAAALQVATPGSIIATSSEHGSIDYSSLRQQELTVFGVTFAHADLLTEIAAIVVKGDLSISDFILEGTLDTNSPEQADIAFAQGKCLVASH